MGVTSEAASCKAAGANGARSWQPVEPAQYFGLNPEGMRSLWRLLSRRAGSSDQHFKIMTKAIERIVDGKTREGDSIGDSGMN